MKIHLVRHTTPDVAANTCYGQADIGVVDSFQEESSAVQVKLLDRYDALFTSPLQRCSLLAEHIDADLRTIEPRIMEYDFGDWELLPWEEIRKQSFQGWAADTVNVPAPNGESLIMMQTRVLSFFEELVSLDYENVAVVTHSGVQRILHAHALSTPLSDIFKLRLDFGAVLELKHNPKNDWLTVRHL